MVLLPYFRSRLEQLPSHLAYRSFLCRSILSSNSKPLSLGTMSRPQTTSAKVGAGTKPRDQTPRPSASLVIINDRDEILLVQRNMQASAFAGVTVRLRTPT